MKPRFLNDILQVYQQELSELAKRGIEWVQIDEPGIRTVQIAGSDPKR
ncbi:hypothetical protein O5287_29670 [Escherichia coli]|nr:hypothetical protein [Escherichia coli]